MTEHFVPLAPQYACTWYPPAGTCPCGPRGWRCTELRWRGTEPRRSSCSSTPGAPRRPRPSASKATTATAERGNRQRVAACLRGLGSKGSPAPHGGNRRPGTPANACGGGDGRACQMVQLHYAAAAAAASARRRRGAKLGVPAGCGDRAHPDARLRTTPSAEVAGDGRLYNVTSTAPGSDRAPVCPPVRQCLATVVGGRTRCMVHGGWPTPPACPLSGAIILLVGSAVVAVGREPCGSGQSLASEPMGPRTHSRRGETRAAPHPPSHAANEPIKR